MANVLETGMSYLQTQDPEVAACIENEFQRQKQNIELIASENIASPAVIAAMGSVLTNKYAEGYPGKRYYGGCDYVDVLETIAIERAKKLFGAAYANVQPHSGAQANLEVYAALLQPGDTLMGMDLASGGHLTHGASANQSGKLYHAVSYGVDPATGRIDYDEVERLAMEHKPKLIICGASAYPRIIDFKRDKDGIPAIVERLEYDPNRSANIALVLYKDGERRYIIAPKGLKAGDEIMSGQEAPIKVGNALPLRNIPVGSTIHNIEMKPGKGAQMVRAAGAFAQLLAREGAYAQIRLRSGEVRRILIECRATIGTVGNEENSLRELGKAGAKRWRGIRPTVRGVVMNPVDHPHGGGEGRTGTGRAPVTPWGQLTKGYRTRNNKRTDNMIVSRRYRK